MANVLQNSFPVSAKVGAGIINNVHTDVAVLGFSNCVVAIVTQLVSVGSIIKAVGTSAAASTQDAFYDAQLAVDQLSTSADIPVEVKFVLGSSSATAASSLYQVLATHIYQHRREKDPLDSRPLIIGIGLRLPREYKLSQLDDDAGQPDLGEFLVTMQAIAGLVDECYAQ
ncbi:hypothetical protein IWW39_004417 [Coemansia spiralis]|uniref:Proteasome assembly chaperone 3 n=1 Tax=Coemansia spiralis TaxID=417178 RepID=A0A9W8L3E4_9FUNG|nr:hypothetical protein IWW39_004417 [Coemansia spiralis]